MPRYRVLDRLQHDGVDYEPGDDSFVTIENETEAGILFDLKVIGRVGRDASVAAAVQTVEQLVRLGKAKMLKIADAESIALPEAATAKVMADAIVAARLAKADGAADAQEGDA